MQASGQSQDSHPYSCILFNWPCSSILLRKPCRLLMLIGEVALFIKNTNKWKTQRGGGEAGVASAQMGIIRPQVIQQPRDNHSSKSLKQPLECSHFTISKGASASGSHGRRVDQQYSGLARVLPYWRWNRKEGTLTERCIALGILSKITEFATTPENASNKKLLIGCVRANWFGYFRYFIFLNCEVTHISYIP